MRFKIVLVKILSVLLFVSMAGIAKADTLGIDVSRWQGEIDWNTAANYTGFAIIKAGGSDDNMYVDSQFERNRNEVRRLGIPRGYYYYAGGGDPQVEAQHFANIVGSLEPGEVVAMDFEIDHPNPVGYSLLFLAKTEELLGVKPLLYTNMNRAWAYDWRPVVEHGNPLWGAVYDEDAATMPAPGHWSAVSLKQFTSGGTVPGIGTNVDYNLFKSGIDDFKALGWAAPQPVVSELPPSEPEPEPIYINFGIREISEMILGSGRKQGESASLPDATAPEAPGGMNTAESGEEGISSESRDLPAAGSGNGEGPASLQAGEGSAPAGNASSEAKGTTTTADDPGSQSADGSAPGSVKGPDEIKPVSSIVTGVFFPLSQIMQVAEGRDEPESCQLNDAEGKWLMSCE